MTIRAVIYTRISGEDQSEYSLDVQKADCTKYCELNEWDIVGVYTDNGVSGATLERPGLNLALDVVKGGGCERFVVWKLDRLSRKVSHTLTIIEEVLTKNAVKFVSKSEPFLSTDSPFGKSILQILAVMAELERENIRLRMTEGKVRGMETRQSWYGSPPYGFMKRKENGLKLEYNNSTLPTVKKIFDLFIYDGLSLRAIARQLNALHLKTSRGGAWSSVAVRDILINDIYTGQTIQRKEQPKDKQIVYRVEPLLSKELWDKAQMLLLSHRNSLRGKSKHQALWSPYLYCAKCGGKMYPQGRNTKSGVVISYSGNRNTTIKPKSRCSNCGWITEENLTLAVLPRILELIEDPEFWVANVEKKKGKDLQPLLSVEIEALGELRRRRGKMGDKYEMGFYLSKSDFQKELSVIDKAMNAREATIGALKQQMMTEHEQGAVIAGLHEFVAKFRSMSLEDMLRTVLDKIHINTQKQELTVSIRHPTAGGPLKVAIPTTDDELLASISRVLPGNFSPDKAEKIRTALGIKKKKKGDGSGGQNGGSGTQSRNVSRRAGESEVNSRSKALNDVLLTQRSNKYHHSWCASGKKIKEENRVWFPSAADAQAAGYSLAGNCQP